MGHPLVEATLELYKNVQASFLPTPLKCHYMFNLRDFAKVIQGKVVCCGFYLKMNVAFTLISFAVLK